MLIVKVLEGQSPSDAQPVIVTSSPAVVRAVGEAIARELGANAPEARLEDKEPKVSKILGGPGLE